MLSPKRVKWRKQHKGKRRGFAYRGGEISFGDFGMQAQGDAWLTARQIEAARIAISRSVKRGGKIWIRVFPDKPITEKTLEVRQGKGKGSPDYWACRVKPGRIMFELDGVSQELAREAFALAAMKLPVKTKFVTRVGADKEAA